MPPADKLGGMKTIALVLACLAMLGGCKDKNEPTKPTVSIQASR